MKEKIKIGGMSCSACALGIERAVKKLDGVTNAEVSLMAKEMTVEYNDHLISAEIIKQTVIKLGYFIDDGQDKSVKESDILKKRFFISLIILLPLIYLCLGKSIGLPVPIDVISFPLQLVLALTIIVINFKFFTSGTKAVIHGAPNMDTLVSLGSAAAFIFSVVITVLTLIGEQASSHAFFDSSAMVLTLVTLGKWLEEISKTKTGDAIEKLSNLLPKTATVLVDGKQKTKLVSELEIGDVLLIKAGEYVTADGQVVEGVAGVDKSVITGESMPEEISVGDKVFSGSIIKEGYILLRAEKVGGETSFSSIVEIVKRAGASKAPVQKFADKVSGVFVPIVTALALVTFTLWIIITGDLYSSFNFGISVLVISCPCALGLATPVAVMAATGKAARHGILFKDAAALQNSAKINVILLDKTATLTVGKPKVTAYLNFTGESNQTLFPIISALEKNSSHPLAKSVIAYCGESDKKVENYRYTIGNGIEGEVDGVKYFIGNIGVLPKGVEIPKLPKEFEGETVIYFADEIQMVSAFAISDYLKDGAADSIKELNDMGIKTVMITGDNKAVAKKIANQAGISEFEAEVLPEDKFKIVEKYKSQGYFTAMVGDGINDSPALKSAHVGIAMGTGTDIAIDSADVVLANGNLSAIGKTIETSKKSFKIIKENLFWAFFYNVLAIPLAGGALSTLGVVLTPIIASALMCCSSLFVVTNALRISSKDKGNKEEKADFEIDLSVVGMTCMHCVSKVKSALEQTDGVVSVKVDLKTNSATLKCSKSVTENQLIEAVENAGFTANVSAKKRL